MDEYVSAGGPEIHIVLVAVIDIVLVEIDLEYILTGFTFLEPVDIYVGMPQAPAVPGHFVQPFFLLVEVHEPVDHSLFRFHCPTFLNNSFR